jgi:ribosome recycling factor
MDESLIRSRMQQVIDLLIPDIATIRTGRANPALVSDLEVLVYGGQQKLKINELGTISVPDPATIVIDPWDKSIIGDIRKGIEAANIGLTPSIDGQVIRISLPPLTGEDREKYVRLLNSKLESAKVMVRQIRGDVMHDIKKSFEEKKMSEDERFRAEKKLQELTDEFISKIEEAGDKKRQELTNV